MKKIFLLLLIFPFFSCEKEETKEDKAAYTIWENMEGKTFVIDVFRQSYWDSQSQDTVHNTFPNELKLVRLEANDTLYVSVGGDSETWPLVYTGAGGIPIETNDVYMPGCTVDYFFMMDGTINITFTESSTQNNITFYTQYLIRAEGE